MHGVERMRFFRAVALVAGAFLLLVHAAGAQGVSPCGVLDSYERAWGQRDVDAALAHFADNATVTLHDSRSRTLRSRQQIGDFLRNAQLDSAPQLTTSRQVEGNTISWSEHIEGQLLNGSELTVQAIIEDGKIRSLVYRPGKLVRTPGSAIVDAADVDPESAATTLAGVVLLGLGLLSLASSPRHVSSGSNLRGRLLRDLKLWQSGSPALL